MRIEDHGGHCFPSAAWSSRLSHEASIGLGGVRNVGMSPFPPGNPVKGAQDRWAGSMSEMLPFSQFPFQVQGGGRMSVCSQLLTCLVNHSSTKISMGRRRWKIMLRVKALSANMVWDVSSGTEVLVSFSGSPPIRDGLIGSQTLRSSFPSHH